MACITVHHWDPVDAGLRELRRVARGPVVVLTLQIDAMPAWQQDHLEEGLRMERAWFPTAEDGALRTQAELDGSLRLIVSEP